MLGGCETGLRQSLAVPWVKLMRSLVFVLVFMLLPCSIPAQDAQTEAFFENRIRPILSGICFRCHGGERISGGLRVDKRSDLLAGGDSGPAIVVGQPESSLLLQAIGRQPDVSAMPPAVEQSLSPQQYVCEVVVAQV